MKAIIDRFEGDTAVLSPMEGGSVINVSRNKLPQSAAPGDTVEQRESGWALVPEDTAARRQRIADKMKDLFND